MFWRFGFSTVSAIETTLDREGATLEDIILEDELLQEVKAQGVKLIDFICKPENILKLVTYIIDDGFDDKTKFKYPFIASEVFGCDVFAICEALIMSPEAMEKLWSLLLLPAPLNHIKASNFTRVNCVLLNKKTAATLSYFRSKPELIKHLFKHSGSAAIMDLMLKLVSVEDLPDGSGTIKWLRDEGLIPHLVDNLDPRLDAETHTTASQALMDIISVSYQSLMPPDQLNPLGQPIETPPSVISGAGSILIDELKTEKHLKKLVSFMLDRDAPHSTSSLTCGINILMEIIRKYCSEIEHVEMLQHEYQLYVQGSRGFASPPTSEKLDLLATDLSDLLNVVYDHLNQFSSFLQHPKDTPEFIETTMGRQPPVGWVRLKICELMAELMHVQYLFTSSPMFDFFVNPPPLPEKPEDSTTKTIDASKPKVVDCLIKISNGLVQENIAITCVTLFFAFRWNNFLHSVVYDMLAKMFNAFTYTCPLPSPTTTITPNSGEDVKQFEVPSAIPPASLLGQTKLKQLREAIKKLIISVFKQGCLMSQITGAQHQNDYEVEQPKGVRIGYMGHLTYVADEVCKIFDRCGAELDDELHDFIVSEDWKEYVKHPLKETRERDVQQLGGVKPEAPVGQGAAFLGGAGSSFGFNNGTSGGAKFGEDADFAKPRKKTDAVRDTEEDDDESGANNRGVAHENTFNDQFARFLCQQMVKDLPDRFLGGDGSDDEEEVEKRWIKNLEGKDINFDIAEAIQSDNPFNGEAAAPDIEDEEGASDDMAEERALASSTDIITEEDTSIANNQTPQFVADFESAFGVKQLQTALPEIPVTTDSGSSTDHEDNTAINSGHASRKESNIPDVE